MTEVDAVHARAPGEPDLFGAGEEPRHGAPEVELPEFVGVLTRAAEVRTKLVGADKHPLPVLCLELRPLSGLKRHTHVERVYSEANRSKAEALAATLKRGMRVAFLTTATDMRIIFPHVRSIRLIEEH